MKQLIQSTISAIFLGSLLSACSSGSGDPSISGRSGSNQAKISINLTDAPVADASEVWVEFTGVEFKPVDGDAFSIDLDTPSKINLLNLYGKNTEILISDEAVPGGSYEWIRLKVNAVEDGVMDSYIKLNDGGVYELSVPSGSTSGLKIPDVGDLQSNSAVKLTIDFDLAHSIVLTGNGKYKLKPVLRVSREGETGTVSGDIPVELLTDASCSDSDPDTGNAVYLFKGSNVTPDDMGSQTEPMTTAQVKLNPGTGKYEYEIGFVPVGDYTLAFTCQYDLDQPDVDDDIVFIGTNQNITVTADTSDDSSGSSMR